MKDNESVTINIVNMGLWATPTSPLPPHLFLLPELGLRW